jgi:hypothetical protein
MGTALLPRYTVLIALYISAEVVGIYYDTGILRLVFSPIYMGFPIINSLANFDHGLKTGIPPIS